MNGRTIAKVTVTRAGSAKVAAALAADRGERWGRCVHDGGYYVGTLDALRAIGAPPQPEAVAEPMPQTVRLPIVGWSGDERRVCLDINGRDRWFPVDRTDGPFADPHCDVDGSRFVIGATHAVHWAAWGTVPWAAGVA